jgi:hypothetical protein
MKQNIYEQQDNPCNKKYKYLAELKKDNFILPPNGFTFDSKIHCFKILDGKTYYRRKDGKPIQGQTPTPTQGQTPTPSKPDTVWSCIEKSDEKHGVTKTKLQPDRKSTRLNSSHMPVH